MSRYVPELLQLSAYRGRTETLTGQLSTSRMARLRDVGWVADEAELTLTLSAENRGDIGLSGNVSSAIQLTCQRCLEAVDVPLQSAFDFVVMDAADARPGDEESAEIIVVDDGMLRLGPLIEDELLLSLPVVARHDDESPCRPTSQQFGPADEQVRDEENPFSVLERLKRGRGD